LEFIHVPDCDTESNPDGDEDHEVEDENIELSLVIMAFVSGLFPLVFFLVVFSEHESEPIIEEPANRDALKSKNDDIFSLGLVSRVSNSEPNRVPHALVDEADKNQRGSCFSGENIVSDSVDGIDRMVGPCIFLVFKIGFRLDIHG